MILRRSFILCLLVVGMALATIQFWVSAFIYRPVALIRTDPGAWGVHDAVFVTIGYGDGTAITGWWIGPGKQEGPVALIVHGRSANISTRAAVMRHLAADGIGVFLFDYRGYGASPGSYSERNLSEDTVAAYRWLRSRNVSARDIVVVGQSIGNSPAAKLAARHPIGALMLISPFTNLPDALTERLPWLPVWLLPWARNRFDVGEPLRRFSGPTLIVASKADGLVPIGNAERLRASAFRPDWLDASPLHHDGMMQMIAEDGRMARAIRSLMRRRTPASRQPTLPNGH